MIATMDNLKKAPDNAIMYCPGCGAEYSADYSDYFMSPADHVFECCGDPMLLIVKKTSYEEIK